MEEGFLPQVLQIMPADGWFAVFENQGKPDFMLLTCWAIVEEEKGFRKVCGMLALDTVGGVEEDDSFVGYCPPNGRHSEQWQKRIDERMIHNEQLRQKRNS